MELKISKRLNTIVDMCEPVDCIIDVGTDHGKVPITIANKKISKHIIATDINEGPLNICIENKNKYLQQKDVIFETIKCDGLLGIDKNLRCAIIISGMGYDLICKILEHIEDYNYEYLILSPHTKITELIKFLDKKNIDIVEERTVFEDDKAYFIIKAKSKIK